MSTDATPELPEPVRTVSNFMRDRFDGEMHAFGLLMLAVTTVLLLTPAAHHRGGLADVPRPRLRPPDRRRRRQRVPRATPGRLSD
jgi:hypothetical protein